MRDVDSQTFVLAEMRAIESRMSPEQHEFDQDWDLSEGLDPDGPSAEDLDRFGDEVDPCPNCGSVIYDQAEMCPNCGWYLGEAPKTMSLWIVAGICGLIMILFWLITMRP